MVISSLIKKWGFDLWSPLLSHVIRAKNNHRCETGYLISSMWDFFMCKNNKQLGCLLRGRAGYMVEKEVKAFSGECRQSIFTESTSLHSRHANICQRYRMNYQIFGTIAEYLAG